MKSSNSLIIFTSVALIGIIGVDIGHAESVPEWVKNTAGWWAEDAISETEFVNAIEHLINIGIIDVDVTQISGHAESVPEWVKNTAGWWADGQIPDSAFIDGIEFLIKEGILHVKQKVYENMNEIWQDENLTIYEKFYVSDSREPFISGYRGATFDGESIYYAPYYNNYERKQGIMLKYDTNLPFDDPDSWSLLNLQKYGVGGFQGAVYHNEFVYYVPYHFEIDSDSRFLRYDTTKEFNNGSAWKAIPISGAGAFEDAVVAKNFIYFSPHLDYNKERNAIPLRYDTTKPFESINAYEQYNSELKISFIGASFDGEFVYYAPFESDYQDKTIILIYDTNREFTDSRAWEELEIPYAQYSGIGFDGQHMIIAPHCFNEGENIICSKILFLDIETREITFSEKTYGSYDGVIETDKGLFLVPDAYATGTRADFLMIKDEIYSYSPKIAKGGYWGGSYDGKYVYYTPYSFPDSSIRNGEFLRYDTTKSFDDESAWEMISLKIKDFFFDPGDLN